MSFTPCSGVLGAVTIGMDSFAFKTWKEEIKATLPKVNNFTSAPFQELVPGLIAGTLTLEGPYDAGNMPFEVTTEYTVTLHWNDSISIDFVGLLESISGSQDVEDAARVSLTFQTSGEFSISIT